MSTKLITFYLDRDYKYKEQELPDWISSEALLKCGNTHGHVLCSFVVDFSHHRYFFLSSCHEELSSCLNFYEGIAPFYDTISYAECNRIKAHVGLLRSFFSGTFSIPDMKDIIVFGEFYMHWMGESLKVTQRFVPLDIDLQGIVKIGVISILPSANTSLGELVIIRDDRMWVFSHSTSSFIEKSIVNVSESEKRMMMLSRMGFPMKVISEKLNISLNTLKKQRNRLFRKLGANCLQGALTIMDNYSLWKKYCDNGEFCEAGLKEQGNDLLA